MQPNEQSLQSKIAEYISLGDVAYSEGELVEASKRYLQARLLFQEEGIDDSPELRHCLKALADIYALREQPEEALDLMEALRALDDSSDNRRSVVTILSTIATSHDMQGDLEEAIAYYKEAFAQANCLLPPDDPLIGRLDKACVEICRKADEQPRTLTEVILNRLPVKDPTVVLAAVDLSPVESAQSSSQSLPAKAPRIKIRHITASGTKMSYILRSHGLSVCLSVMLLACLIKAVVPGSVTRPVPRAGSVVAKLDGEQFQSSDQKASFSILSKRECVIKGPSFRGQCQYTIMDSSWPDLIAILRGYLRRDELWYQVNETQVIDPDKTILYRANAPELAIIKKMWWYAYFAQKWYHEKHQYPTDAEKCQLLDKEFQFLNPFTLKQDSAVIVRMKHMIKDPSRAMRPASGLSQPHWRPGGIYCMCIEGQKFFIHGCDGLGRPLTASDPKRYFVIECIDGTDITKAKLLKDDDENKTRSGNGQQRVYVCSNPEQEATVRYLRSVSCALAWLAAIFAAAWCLATFKLKQSVLLKASSILLTVLACCVLVGWYLLAYAQE